MRRSLARIESHFLLAHLFAVLIVLSISFPLKASGALASQETSGERTFTLSFSVTHHATESQFQQFATEEGYIEMQVVLLDSQGERAQYPTYLIAIKGIGDERPVLEDAFHAPDGNLTLVLIPDEGETRVFGAHDDFIQAWVADDSGSIKVLGSEVRQDGWYDISIQLIGIDSIRNLLPPDQSPTLNLGWGQEDVSEQVSFSLREDQPRTPPVPQEPIVGLRTDKELYEVGDAVEISANVGPETARFIREGNGTVGIRVNSGDPPGIFVLMDDITNVTEDGDVVYSFQMKGIGAAQSGIFNVQLLSPSNSANTRYNYTYTQEKAVASNPMIIDWGGDGEPWLYGLDIVDKRYGADPLDIEAQRLEYSFSREIKYKIIPEDSAAIVNMTAYHLKVGNDSVLGAWIELGLDPQEEGTLIIDIPIDVVQPNPLKLRGFEARLLNGSAPFDITPNVGSASSELLYYNEVQHVIAIHFTPEQRFFSVRGMTAEPVSESLLEAYAVPEFSHIVMISATVLVLVMVMRFGYKGSIWPSSVR